MDMVAQLDATYIYTRPTKLVTRLASYALFEGRPLTTRGRWINPVVFGQFALVRRLPQLRAVDRPVFILGTGRSGTTVLGKVLSMHPHVGFLNEPKALWHVVHTGEDVAGNYTRGAARFRLGADDATPEVSRRAHRLYGYYLALTRSRRVVDKYPELIFRVPFVRAVFPDARFVWLVRNGWDTAHSITKWSEREGREVQGEVHDWWGADLRKWRLMVEELVPEHPEFQAHLDDIATLTRHEDMAAVEWTVTMREGIRLMESEPGLLHRVRYEDLTARPVETLRALSAFCGLPEDHRLLDYAARTLSPQMPRPAVDLHPAVRPAFLATMEALGYPTEPSAS